MLKWTFNIGTLRIKPALNVIDRWYCMLIGASFCLTVRVFRTKHLVRVFGHKIAVAAAATVVVAVVAVPVSMPTVKTV